MLLLRAGIEKLRPVKQKLCFLIKNKIKPLLKIMDVQTLQINFCLKHFCCIYSHYIYSYYFH